MLLTLIISTERGLREGAIVSFRTRGFVVCRLSAFVISTKRGLFSILGKGRQLKWARCLVTESNHRLVIFRGLRRSFFERIRRGINNMRAIQGRT